MNIKALKSLADIPGPTKLALIRDHLPFGTLYRKTSSELYNTYRKRHGNIFRLPGIYSNDSLEVVLFDPRDFEHVFRTEGLWPTRKGLSSMKHYRHVRRNELFGDAAGLDVEHGESWSNQRSVANHLMMKPDALKNYLPRIDKISKEFIEVIKNQRAPLTFEVKDNFELSVDYWALESIASVGFNTSFGFLSGRENALAKQFYRNFKEYSKISYKLDIEFKVIDILRYFKFQKSMWLLEKITKFWILELDKTEVISLVQKLHKKEQSNVLGVAMDILMAGVDVVSEFDKDAEMGLLHVIKRDDKKFANGLAMDMLFAGVETTSSALVGLLLNLSADLNKQEILRKEIESIEEPLSFDNMKNLPYLRACIKESLRLYPVAPVNSRTTTQEIVIQDFRIPKHTDIVMPMINLMRDEQYFQNANHFIPERWLRGNEHFKVRDPFVYLPFGFGPRACVGKRIAMMELEVVVINILKNFKIQYYHSRNNAFVPRFINVPNLPLKFTFRDYT
ncbi:hypothetical protein ACFFRR_003348 [Megaselia abdita]